MQFVEKKRRLYMSDNVKLTSFSSAAGCGAKLKARDLMKVLEGLPSFKDEHLEVGFDGAEDALVYNITNDLSLVSTVDFFPPMVDDPFIFGQIAAANALSDIYAMGADPIYALSLMCFVQKLDKGILKRILEGGISKATEAGIAIAGGHTIEDQGIKYGLAVTGKVEKNKVWRNNTIVKGDAIVLTKALGVGIINTAYRCSAVSQQGIKSAIDSMTLLNKYACLIAKNHTVHAATDVTGFGLLGHLAEMTDKKEYSIRIKAKAVPYIEEAFSLAEYGYLPCASYYNREYTEGKILIKESIPLPLTDILYDPQTSGGLLLSLPYNEAEEFVSEYTDATIIGEVTDKDTHQIIVE